MKQRWLALGLAIVSMAAADATELRATAEEGSTLSRAECVKLAREKKQLEASGILDKISLTPEAAVAKHGRTVLTSVRQYISLRERVLFQCPLHVLNATAAPLALREKGLPPLPKKGPKRVGARAVVKKARRSGAVPLPVKRPVRVVIPASQR